MRVLITGAAGFIGSAIAARLKQSGMELRLIDIVPEAEVDDKDYTTCNVMDMENLQKHVQGCDAIVHMAAIASPISFPGEEVYQINTIGTFNIFEAAAKAGIKRIVQASSINAIGCAWNIGEFVPAYLPLDEEHPRFTSDPYSFSKQIVEDIGDYYWRRDGISSVGLRFPAVYRSKFFTDDNFLQNIRNMRDFIDDFASQPEDERHQKLATIKQKALEFRGNRLLEYPPQQRPQANQDDPDTMLFKAYTFDRYNLWAYVDVRDAAQSVEKALTANFEGAHPLFINNDTNSLNYDSHTLIRIFFPEVIKQYESLNDKASLVSIRKARQLIGFEPEYTLRA